MVSNIISLLPLIGLYVVSFLATVTVHEFAHGWVANLCGDPTAKSRGRLSFNPLKHIDPFWTIVFPILMYVAMGIPLGMAKPVPVNFMRLNNPKRDMVLVSATSIANRLGSRMAFII